MTDQPQPRRRVCPRCTFETDQAELDAYDGLCACCFAPGRRVADRKRRLREDHSVRPGSQYA